MTGIDVDHLRHDTEVLQEVTGGRRCHRQGKHRVHQPGLDHVVHELREHARISVLEPQPLAALGIEPQFGAGPEPGVDTNDLGLQPKAPAKFEHVPGRSALPGADLDDQPRLHHLDGLLEELMRAPPSLEIKLEACSIQAAVVLVDADSREDRAQATRHRVSS